MTDRVDSASLQRKGVRLSVSSLYKSNFKDLKRKKLTIDLSLEWAVSYTHLMFESHPFCRKDPFDSEKRLIILKRNYDTKHRKVAENNIPQQSRKH